MFKLLVIVESSTTNSAGGVAVAMQVVQFDSMGEANTAYKSLLETSERAGGVNFAILATKLY